MVEGLTYFGSHSKNELKSIGLVFGPNFFTIYFYADAGSRELSAYRSFDSIEKLSEINLEDLPANYALSFNSDWTLVPQNVFDESDVLPWLRFNSSVQATQAEWERLIGLGAVLVYDQNSKAQKIVENLFPGLRLKHGMGALIEFCRYCRKDTDETRAYLHQAGNRYSLIVFDNEKLVFANTITALYNEDVRYFVLYTFKTLDLKPNTTLHLLGAAQRNTTLRNNLETYIDFLKDTISVSENSIPSTDTSVNAEHWVGIFARICAL